MRSRWDTSLCRRESRLLQFQQEALVGKRNKGRKYTWKISPGNHLKNISSKFINFLPNCICTNHCGWKSPKIVSSFEKTLMRHIWVNFLLNCQHTYVKKFEKTLAALMATLARALSSLKQTNSMQRLCLCFT